jgi:hypothetical protein
MASFNPNPNKRDPLGVSSGGAGVTPGPLPNLPSLPVPPNNTPPKTPANGGGFNLPFPQPPVAPSPTVPSVPSVSEDSTNSSTVETENDETRGFYPNEGIEPNPYWDETEDGPLELTEEEIEELARSSEQEELTDEEWATVDGAVLAMNRDTPLATLFALAQNTDIMIRESLALSTTTPAEVLDLMANDSEAIILLRVLNNPNTSDATFSRFIMATDPMVIMSFVEHPRTTREMLLQMSNRSDIHGNEGFVLRMSLHDSPKLTVADKQRIPPL